MSTIDDLANDLYDLIHTNGRTISTDDYDDVADGWELGIEADYSGAEPSPEGEYHDDARPGAYDRRDLAGGWDTRTYRYWTPGNATEADYMAAELTSGATYAQAAETARYLIECDERRDRTAAQVPHIVTASREGVELGTSCVWIETSEEDDWNDQRAYFVEVIGDAITDAIENAEHTLSRLTTVR